MSQNIQQPEQINLSIPQDTSPVERLEFGKYCQTHDGAILVGEEHGYLGKSPDFPYWLREHCVPSQLGVRASLSEPLWRQAPHSTALRPVLRNKDASTPVFYRIRQRLESPNDGPASREYTLGRYLWSSEGRPSHFLQAMDSEPLAGLTAQECGDLGPISPSQVDCSVSSSPAVDIDELLIFVMSGIPICFPVWMEELDFFSVVDAVWRRLPNDLQPLLSAGWNVGNSLLGVVIITCGPGEPTNAAICRSGRLYPPSTIRYWNEAAGKEERINFDDSFLSPGRTFVRRTRVGEVAWQTITRHSLDVEVAKSFIFPDFQDRRTIFRFRRAGFGNDEIAFIRSWIESSAPESELLSILPQLEHVDEACELLLQEWTSRRFAPRLERAVFLFASEYKEFDKILAAKSPRYKLLKTLDQPDRREAWDAYVACVRANELEPLPEGSRPSIERILDYSLQLLPALDNHLLLLSVPQLPELHRQWLRHHAFDLAIRACNSHSDPAPYIHALTGVGGDPTIDVLLSFVSRENPQPNAVQVIVASHCNVAFASLLMQAWTSRSHSGVPALVRWLRSFKDYLPSQPDPLLQIVLGKSPRDINPEKVCRELANWNPAVQAAPDEFERYVFENWRQCEPHVRRQPEVWHPITSRWSSSLQFLLLGRSTPVKQNDPIRCDYLQVWLWALDLWTSEKRAGDLNRAGSLLFDWAVSLNIREKEPVADGLKSLSNRLAPKRMSPESFRKLQLIATTSRRVDLELLRQITPLSFETTRGNEAPKRGLHEKQESPFWTRTSVKVLQEGQRFLRAWGRFARNWILLPLMLIISFAVAAVLIWRIKDNSASPTVQKQALPKGSEANQPQRSKTTSLPSYTEQTNVLDSTLRAADDHVVLKQLSLPGTKQLWPRWSPDGGGFAYTAQVNGIRQVFVSYPRSVKQLTHQLTDCTDPFWSREGTEIYYISSRTLWTISASGGNSTKIVPDVLGAAIHPTGEVIALVHSGRLWMTSTDSIDERRVQGVRPFSPDIAFSPDGSELGLFAESESYAEPNFCLISYPELKVTLCQQQAIAEFGWFPKGDQIVFATSKSTATGAWRLETLDVRSRKRRILLERPVQIRFPSVDRRGQAILVSIGGEIVRLEDLGD